MTFPCVNPIQLAPNFIFDIFEHQTFQKYSICWVFQAFFCSTFLHIFCNSTKYSVYRSSDIYNIFFRDQLFPVPVRFSGIGTSTFFRDHHGQFFPVLVLFTVPVLVSSKKEQNSRYQDVTLWPTGQSQC